MNGVAAILVHYRDAWATRSAVTRLLDGGWPADDIYVSDNSEDGWYVPVAGENVLGGGNVGFAGGVNRALKATRDKYRWQLISNDDALITSSSAEALVQVADGIEGCMFAGPTVLTTNGKVWSAGGIVDWRIGRAWQIALGKKVTELSGAAVKVVDFVPGCCFLARGDVLTQVGEMDEGYFMYWEDVDWCIAAARRGYVSVWAPGVTAIHESTWYATGAEAARVIAASMINSRRFFRKYSGSNKWAGCLLMGGAACLSTMKRHRRTTGMITAFAKGLLGVWPYTSSR